MAQEVFKRYEKKYLLSTEQYNALLPELVKRVKMDEYGKYTICNVYFDTPNYEFIRTSLEKPLYKEKLRLRSYGEPKPEDTVFVEIKKKYDGVVYKRRTQMTLEEAEKYLYQGIQPDIDCQIMKELNWFTERYLLRPAVYLAYDRLAFQGVEDEELRVTSDSNIRYRESKMNLSAGSAGTTLMPEDTILMEVKIPEIMPLWMSKQLSELNIFPTSFSKYGTYYKKNMHVLMKGNRKYA